MGVLVMAMIGCEELPLDDSVLTLLESFSRARGREEVWEWKYDGLFGSGLEQLQKEKHCWASGSLNTTVVVTKRVLFVFECSKWGGFLYDSQLRKSILKLYDSFADEFRAQEMIIFPDSGPPDCVFELVLEDPNQWDYPAARQEMEKLCGPPSTIEEILTFSDECLPDNAYFLRRAPWREL